MAYSIAMVTFCFRKRTLTCLTIIETWLMSLLQRGQYLCVDCTRNESNYILRYLFSISVSVLEILISKTKVGNFAHIVVIKKNISSCQVTMDYLQKDIVFLFKNTTSQKTNLVMVFLKKKKEHVNFPKSLHPSLFGNQGPSI